jgi:hypothetical protein
MHGGLTCPFFSDMWALCIFLTSLTVNRLMTRSSKFIMRSFLLKAGTCSTQRYIVTL